MKYLFNSQGQHIANVIRDQLYAPTGANIGHFLANYGFFIDMSGRYLGEIVSQDRLMSSRSTPYRSTNFGSYGNYGNAGNYGNPGNHGNIGMMGGYDDVVADWLS